MASRAPALSPGLLKPFAVVHLPPPAELLSIYLYVVDSWTISRRLLVGAQALAHSGNDLRDRGAFTNSFSIDMAGGVPCAARAYRLRELCKRS